MVRTTKTAAAKKTETVIETAPVVEATPAVEAAAPAEEAAPISTVFAQFGGFMASFKLSALKCLLFAPSFVDLSVK